MRLAAKLLKKAETTPQEGSIWVSPKGVREEDYVVAMVLDSDEVFWYDGRPAWKMPMKHFLQQKVKNNLVLTPLELPMKKMSEQEILGGSLDPLIQECKGLGLPQDILPILLGQVWAPEFYKELGHGADRTVFQVGNVALKLCSAYNSWYQNEVEVQFARRFPDLPLNKPLKWGKDYSYLVAPIVEPFNPKVFKATYGCSLVDFWFGEDEDLSEEALVLKRAFEEAGIQDLEQPENWGTLNGRPIVLDFGINNGW